MAKTRPVKLFQRATMRGPRINSGDPEWRQKSPKSWKVAPAATSQHGMWARAPGGRVDEKSGGVGKGVGCGGWRNDKIKR